MSVKRTLTMPDDVYLELKAQAAAEGVPFNRLAVQRLRGDGVIMLNPSDLGQALQNLYGALNRCPFDMKEVKKACQSCEFFLAELMNRGGWKP